MLSALEKKDLQEKGDKIKIRPKQDWEVAKWELRAERVGGRRQAFISPNTENRKEARVGGRFLFLSLLKMK